MSELSRQLTITTGGASRMIERLERDGLVSRVPSTSDRRVVYAEVTETGRAELARVIGPHLDDLRDIFTVRLRPDLVADLERGLRALRDALLEYPQPGEQPDDEGDADATGEPSASATEPAAGEE